MELREALRRDFGIEVLVDRGNGERGDPFRIEPCSAPEATRTQLDLLRGLARGRRELWRLLGSEPAHEVGATIQRLRIDSVSFTPDQVVSQTRAYYFDVGEVNGTPEASASLIEWTDPRTRFAAPFQIGWLHFDRAIGGKAAGSALDTTLQYSSVGSKASIYVYGRIDQSPEEAAAREFRAIFDEASASRPDTQTPWPAIEIGPFRLRYFIVGEELSVAGLTVLGQHFVKLRLTFMDDFKMRELMKDTIQELARLASTCNVSGHTVSDHTLH